MVVGSANEPCSVGERYDGKKMKRSPQTIPQNYTSFNNGFNQQLKSASRRNGDKLQMHQAKKDAPFCSKKTFIGK